MQKPCGRCGKTERGANGQCKPCKRAHAKARGATPEGKVAKRASRDISEEARAARQAKRGSEGELWRRRQRRTKTEVRERERRYARKPDVVLRRYAIRYKIPAADLAALIASQENKCGSCGDDLVSGHGTHIDHDHATGKVRGILCRDCNLAEGFLRGSPERARKLAAYLDRHASPIAPGIETDAAPDRLLTSES